jgi:CRISPR-associated endoribonuclease Cas6
MESPLSHFKIAQFKFFLKALNCVSLPVYKGSTFRGAFGHAFKKVVCVNRERICSSCLLKEKCVYSYVFETPPPSDTLKMRKYPFAPHPFIITPPLEPKRIYQEGEALCFELTLIGKSIDYLPYFIYTFDELGGMGIGSGKGKYRLEEVKTDRSGEGFKVKGGETKDECQRPKVNGEKGETIYSGNEKVLHSSNWVVGIDDLFAFHLSPTALHLIFLTPTRLKFDGKISPSLEFHILIRNLLRRISLLSYFHCSEELTLDFKGLIEESKKVGVKKSDLSWFDWERYSNRQETKMKMGGFTGTIHFEGGLEPFLPFLLLGEYVHVGKGSSFGLGKYEIMRA